MYNYISSLIQCTKGMDIHPTVTATHILNQSPHLHVVCHGVKTNVHVMVVSGLDVCIMLERRCVQGIKTLQVTVLTVGMYIINMYDNLLFIYSNIYNI